MVKENYKISNVESNAINALKGIFIILIVFIHTRAYTGKGFVDMVGRGIDLNTPVWLWNFEYILSSIIAHVAVPGYFIISSVLLYKKDFVWKDNIKKKFRTIVIPYLVVISIWILIYALLQLLPQAKPFFSNESKLIRNWTLFDYADAYLGLTQSPLVYPLWFIQNLFVLNLLSVIIRKVIDRFPIFTLLVLTVLLLSGLKSPFFCLEIHSLFYFSIGYYIVKYNLHEDRLQGVNLTKLTLLYIISCFVAYVLKDSSEWDYSIADNVNIVIGLIWLLMVVIRINAYEKSSLIRILSEYNFFIFLFHEMNTRIALKATAKVFGNSVFVQIIQYFLTPTIIILLCIIVGMFLKKYLLNIYRIVSGNR